VAGEVPASPSTPGERLALWCARLPAPAPEMLRTLVGQGRQYMDAGELAAALGKKPTGGHWNSGIAVLRNNGLIEVETAAAAAAIVPRRYCAIGDDRAASNWRFGHGCRPGGRSRVEAFPRRARRHLRPLPVFSAPQRGVSVRRAAAQQMTKPVFRHPARPREMRFPGPPCSAGLPGGIDMQDKRRDFAPIGALGFCIQEAQIGYEMLFIIAR
jgi:hypothetical protein